MRDLLEKMSFAGQAVGQKPGDQVRGSEPMPKKGGGKKHPYAGRLVGGCSESVEENEEYCDACDRVKSKCICDEKSSLKEEFEQFVAEYGAPGTVIPSEVGVDPKEVAAARMQQDQQKDQAQAQVDGLKAQIFGLRNQMADLMTQFPQGASPQEKAATMKQLQDQRLGITSQIEDLTQQLAAARAAVS
jgi:hypothetical protein